VDVGTGTDTVMLTGIQTTSANLTIITGMTAGDIINLTLVKNGAANTAQTVMGANLGVQASLAAGLAAATAGDGSVTTILKWFQFGGNTYIVEDTSAAGTFVNGSDTVVQLVGAFDLSTSTIAANVITLV
jgi:S-layer protein